jgi:hypothetical protein
MNDSSLSDLLRIKRGLASIGYSSCKEGQLVAEFALHSPWALKYVRERYGSGRTLILIPSISVRANRKEYAVWVLMKVFENLTGEMFGPPTLDAQMRFLSEKKEVVFNDPAFYDAEYSRVNDSV